jgi:hypothetical protein
MEIGTQYGGRDGATAEAKDKARQLQRTARDRAMATLGDRKDQLSGLLDRMADTMQDDALGGYASEYARRGAELLRRQSADDLFRSVRQGVRSRPGVLLGACFVAGLAFARLMKGSASDGEWGGERRADGRFDAERWGDRGYGGSGYREGSWAQRGAGEPPLREGEP